MQNTVKKHTIIITVNYENKEKMTLKSIWKKLSSLNNNDE